MNKYLEAKALLNDIIAGKITADDIISRCTADVSHMIEQARTVYFCGKLPWAVRLYDEIRKIYSEKQFAFIDVLESGSGTLSLDLARKTLVRGGGYNIYYLFPLALCRVL